MSRDKTKPEGISLVESSFDRELKDIEVPKINVSQKRRAISEALTEFNAVYSSSTEQDNKKIVKKRQRFWSFLRPIVKSLLIRWTTMNDTLGLKLDFLSKRTFYSGMTAASIAVLGVVFIFPETHNAIENSPTEEEVAVLADARIAESLPQPDAEVEYFSSKDAYEIKKKLKTAQSKRVRESSVTTELAHQLEEEEVVVTGLRDSNIGSYNAIATEPTAYDSAVKGRDKFEAHRKNGVKLVTEEPVSTFSVDVDTSSYSFTRRQLNRGVLPQKDAVRPEEMINYFNYAYPLPKAKSEPFKPSIVVQPSPWANDKKLIHIGIKGFDIPRDDQPKSNLVFLLDVSGSMDSPDKLPLVKQSMNMLLERLRPNDTVGIVVYAGAAGQVLEPTPVKNKQTILNALNRLQAGGATAGAEGIQLAYQLAESNFDADAVNRIIIATDGDFNVGISNREELKGFVERKREQGIYLSVLGFGQGNYHDHMMQVLAQNGNGVAAYIDSLGEAQKVLVDQATSTLFPIAKDVKIQVEFNPKTVAEYRLIGYETRQLKREDFNNDAVDAGDIGAGHSVTAIYEITPVASNGKLIDPLRYGNETKNSSSSETNNEYGFLKIRYKLPSESKSKLISRRIAQNDSDDSKALLVESQFASAVAAFAQHLSGGEYINNFDYDDIIALAQKGKGDDVYGYRSEFIQLVRRAKVASEL